MKGNHGPLTLYLRCQKETQKNTKKTVNNKRDK